MEKVHAHVSETIHANISKVWPVLEDFGNITCWVPGIDGLEVIGEGIGMIRRIHVDGLAEPIDEQLESLDSSNHAFSYGIPKGLPFPLKNYHAFAKLTAIDENSCKVEWRSDCEPDGLSVDDATAMLEGTYRQLIGWLKDHCE